MIVDFHCHSNASDGTFPPASLAAEADRLGFAAVAITDHDNCDGVAEFLSASGKAMRVAGIELSIDAGEGFDQFHLLGLGIDPGNAELKAFLARILEGRNERNERIFANFRRIGIDPKPEPHGEVLARPHFARWLVANGYAEDIPGAFAKYLAPDSPAGTRCYETRYHPSQEDAFRAIHAAGGLCVMAHPKYWRRAWKTEGCDFAAAERELARLAGAGLDGLEARYQANTEEENEAFTRIADRLGLLKSAGSDFHGSNKPAITIGMEVDEAYISPLISALDRFTDAAKI